MERRDFLKGVFGTSAAVVALGDLSPVYATAQTPKALEAVAIRLTDIVPDPSGRDVNCYSDNSLVATTHPIRMCEYVLDRLNAMLGDHPRILAHHPIETARHFGGLDLNRGLARGQRDGHRPGGTVWSYAPGPERWKSPRLVTLAHQIGVVFPIPSRVNDERREMYNPMSDRIANVPVFEPMAVELKKLDPAIEHLRDEILARKMNVFTPEFYMPVFGPPDGHPSEACVGMASQDYGLAIRLVRALTATELLLRIDLLGGTFPTESVTQSDV